MRRALVASALLVAVACNRPGVRLEHVLAGPEGVQSYRWSLAATTHIDSPEQVSRREIALDARVTIRRVTQKGADLVRVTIEPTRFVEDAIATTGLRPTTITFRIGPEGATVVDSSGQQTATSGALAAILGDELASAPEGPIDIGDGWSSPLVVTGDKEKMDLTGRSRLTGFSVASRRRAALVTTERSGPISTTQVIGRAPATLDGHIDQTVRTRLDVDDGSLVSSLTTATSTFAISIGGTPQGTVKVKQRSSLTLSGYSSL